MKRDVVGDDSTSRSSKRVKSAEGADTESDYGSMSDDGEADESAPTVKRDHARYLTPRNFWLDHIMKRQPLVIGGHPQEKAWKVSRKWTDNYMTNHEGSATVTVESRGATVDGAFGPSRTQTMHFKDFLKRLQAGEQNLYLITQSDLKAPDGHVVFCDNLLMCHDFPDRPWLTGGLVPFQVNLWMGSAKPGPFSRLHHDYHDTLYILLRGRVRVRLFPPSMAHRMYTHGQIRTVYPNGRIVYEGQGKIAADGRRPAAARTAMLHELGERVSEADNERSDVHITKPNQPRGVYLRNPEYDVVVDKYERVAAELDAFEAENLSTSAASEEEEYAPLGYRDLQDWNNPLRENSDEEEEEEGEEEEPDPDNYSRVDMDADPAELAQHFPEFPGAAAALTVEIDAWDSEDDTSMEPEMLYVPAGWFYDVTSCGKGKAPAPMAFTYWFHPPDNLTRQGFLKPYTSGFWPLHFKQRFDEGQDDGSLAYQIFRAMEDEDASDSSE